MKWIYLAGAIVSEVIATSALKSSQGFTRLIPSILVAIGYASAFYCLSITLKTVPIGVAYALWSGIGIVLVSIVGVLAYKQTLDLAGVLGISLITLGVIVLCFFSKTMGHE